MYVKCSVRFTLERSHEKRCAQWVAHSALGQVIRVTIPKRGFLLGQIRIAVLDKGGPSIDYPHYGANHRSFCTPAIGDAIVVKQDELIRLGLL